MYSNYWIEIKKQKQYAQPTTSLHVARWPTNFFLSAVETIQSLLIPRHYTQVYNTLVVWN